MDVSNVLLTFKLNEMSYSHFSGRSQEGIGRLKRPIPHFPTERFKFKCFPTSRLKLSYSHLLNGRFTGPIHEANRKREYPEKLKKKKKCE